MTKTKWMLIGILLGIIFTSLFLWEWGWIISLIFSFIILIVMFNPKGGKITNDIKNLLQTMMETNRKETFIQNTFLPEPGAKIAVGLSGGVDSAVSALLLKQAGYKVEAFFMRNWDSTANSELNHILTEDEICQQELDYNDAKKVANQLGIKLHRVDFVKEYWTLVFKKFLKEIELGMTPNPDIFCNRFIKFDKFFDHVFSDKSFDYVAMGHYARIVKIDDEFFLGEAVDYFKDQTYFLAEIKKEKLQKIYFPLGELTKKEVRQIALDNKLSVAEKKDSTGICFIGKRNFPEFINNYFDKKPGDIIDETTNKKIGTHDGVLFYTIGQRRGLNLGGFNQPYFVSNKNVKTNVLYVSNGDLNARLFSTKITATNFNLLVDHKEVMGNVEIKIRHSEVKYEATIISFDKNVVIVETIKPVRAVTTGQELVLYKEYICLGGGQIV